MPRDLIHDALGGVIGALVAMALVALVLVLTANDDDPVVPEPTTTTPTFGTTVELPDLCEQLPERC